MSKIAKTDFINEMDEKMKPLLSQDQFADECIIEIKQHPSKFEFMHLLPSNNFPLIFSFIHPTDFPQIMWVNKTFHKDSCLYIKILTSPQKILISQEIIRSTIDTMKKITEDCKEYFTREVSNSLISSDDLKFDDPTYLLQKLTTPTSQELDAVEQLLSPIREDHLNDKKNQNLLLYTAVGLYFCGGCGLWTTFFMWMGKVTPLILKIVASASGGILVLTCLIFNLSEKIRRRITKGCFRETSINFHGYNLWNEDAMRLRRAITYLRLLDNNSFTGHSVT